MENNHLCATCQRCGGTIKDDDACVIDHISLLPLKYPQMDVNECEYYLENPMVSMEINTGNIEEENKSELNFIQKNADDLDKMTNFEPHVESLPQINIVNQSTGKTLSDEEYEAWKNNIYKHMNTIEQFKEKFYKAYGLKLTDDGKVVEENTESAKDMLNGTTELKYIKQVTNWKRVLNAARATIGKDLTDKEPSPTFKAGILLAEHSPIRLLEYDFGWKKIRQWVTTHLVRHHEGCEKFVHTQRGDRRELPCERDYLLQGSKNDMDMSCNAQAMINISRKRLCSRASKETREAWTLVINELSKIDPILAYKCVPECVYRGFCPEWIKSCGYYKTDAFKQQLANYRRIKYGNNRKFYAINKGPGKLQVLVENTGHIYQLPTDNSGNLLPTGEISFEKIKDYPPLVELEYEKHKRNNGLELCIKNPIIPVSSLVYYCFGNDVIVFGEDENLIHIDGNIYNNDIDNIINLNSTKKEKREA